MKHTLMRGGLIPVCLTLLAISFGLLIASCNDSAIPEVELPEQSSLDTPESYLKAIAKAQTDLLSHATSAMREMDDGEFEQVMHNVENVLESSPVYQAYLKSEGDFEVKKFSEEEYNQNEWYESSRDDYLKAFNPIVPMEKLIEIESLVTEFFAVYGAAEIDTTGWRATMKRASQGALAGTSDLNCGSPEQIKINHASIFPMSSIAIITNWFRGSEMEEAMCKSCCIECCGCARGCHYDLQDSTSDWMASGLIGGAACVIGTAGTGFLICAGAIFAGYGYGLWQTLRRYRRCRGDCKAAQHCQRCPNAINYHQPGTSCRNSHTW